MLFRSTVLEVHCVSSVCFVEVITFAVLLRDQQTVGSNEVERNAHLLKSTGYRKLAAHRHLIYIMLPILIEFVYPRPPEVPDSPDASELRLRILRSGERVWFPKEARSFRRTKLSLRKHIRFLHGPRRGLDECHLRFAFHGREHERQE